VGVAEEEEEEDLQPPTLTSHNNLHNQPKM